MSFLANPAGPSPTMARSLPPSAFESLAQHRSRFLAFLPSGIVPDGDEEDVIQEAYLKALTTQAGPRGAERTLAWFARLVRNTAIDRHRRICAERRQRTRWAIDPTTLPDDSLEAAAMVPCPCLERSLTALSPSYRGVLRRVVLDGASVSQVAHELDLTPNNLRVRLHRARQALRARMAERCGHETTGRCGRCSCGTLEREGPSQAAA